MKGSIFGRYLLLELLGRGGMGEVWKAHDSATERVVAVKVLGRQFAGDEVFQQRFHREARAAAGLSDPHVVPIHGYGEVDGRLYVEMRLIEGRGLDEVLAGGPLPPERAVQIVEHVASALDAAHRVGLVHRDVKPSNILLTADGFAYLIDFGIARQTGDVGLTQTGAPVGSWAYMAPERIRANVVDARSDVYALACVLHECLTGARPYIGNTFEELAAAHLWVAPPVPSRGRAAVPAEFDAVIAAGLAKDLDQRFTSARDLAWAAREALDPSGPQTWRALIPVANPMTTPGAGLPDRVGFPETMVRPPPADAAVTGQAAGGLGPRSFPWPPVDDPDRAPYRGWQPFEPVDAGIFFGRDAQIVRAVDAVGRMRQARDKSWLVILGPSGSGKSAFLRAGLVPRLLRADDDFVVLPIVRPEREAIDGATGLASAIHAARQAVSLPGPTVGEIKSACARDPDRVRALLAEVQRCAADRVGAGRTPTLVLPLDQCEEVLAVDAGPQGRQFLELISELTTPSPDGERLDLIVAATIRTDRFEALQTRPEMAEARMEVFAELKPMPREQFREIILGPATASADVKRQLAVAADLVERLLADCREGSDTLPLLSLTLARLYGDFGVTSKVLTLAQYEQMGGLKKVVQSEIDAALAHDETQRGEQLVALRAAFIPWLATISPETDLPLRRVARYEDLPAASRPLVDALVARRLLVKDVRDGQVVVEVALESLLRQWDELAAWLRAERANLTTAEDLERVAATWQSHHRDPAWLLAGSRLTDAEGLIRTPGFTERLSSTTDFIRASRAAEDNRLEEEERQRNHELHVAEERRATAEAHAATLKKRSRVLRTVLAVTAVVAVVAAILGVFSFTQRQTALRQRDAGIALKLNTEAQAMMDGDRPGGDIRAFQKLLAARQIALPDDGALIRAVAQRTTTLRIFEFDKTPSRAPGHPSDVAFSPDRRRIAAAGSDNTPRFFSVDTGQPIGQPLTGHAGKVSGLAFSPDGHRLASASEDRSVRLWNADSGQPIGEPLTGHTDAVVNVVFSPDGRRLASAGADNTVRLWNADTGKQIGAPLTGHTDWVTRVTFSPDGRRLASASRDNTVRLWNANTGKQIGAPLTGHTNWVTRVAFSPDGRRLASASTDATVRLWDANTGEPIGAPLVGHTLDVYDAEFSPDGHRIATGSADTTVRLWDADTGNPLGGPLTGHSNNVIDVAFSPDGHSLVSASDDNTVRLWDAGNPITGHDGGVNELAWSPDGHRVASAGDDKTVRLWSPDTGQEIGGPLTGHTDVVYSVKFSPDGRRLASASEDSSIRLWNADSGQPIGEPLTGHTDAVVGVVFSPDGRRLASASIDHTVRLWDADTGKQIGAPLTGHTAAVYGVAFSPDGRRLASASVDRTVRLWDADSGQPIGEPLTGHTGAVAGVTFSPDGLKIASNSSDNTVRLWDARTGTPIGAPLTAHSGSVNWVSFSPDGHQLATASDDATVRLWNADTGQPIGDPISGHTGFVTSVVFSPDGHRIASSSSDSTVRLWDVEPSPQLLCDKLTTNMSHRQWTDQVSSDIPYVTLCPGLPFVPD